MGKAITDKLVKLADGFLIRPNSVTAIKVTGYHPGEHKGIVIIASNRQFFLKATLDASMHELETIVDYFLNHLEHGDLDCNFGQGLIDSHSHMWVV